MFPRVKRTGHYEYLQIVHNERVGRRVCQRVLVTLGRLDELQKSGWRGFWSRYPPGLKQNRKV